MQRLLIIALLDRLVPDCRTSNFTPFANKKVALAQPKTLEIRGGHFNNTQVAEINPPPLDGSIAQIRLRHADVLFRVEHFAELD